METTIAHPPETLEGWYVLHQFLAIDRPALRALGPDLARLREEAAAALAPLEHPEGGGWTIAVPLVGSRADVLLMHVRPTLDAIGEAQRAVSRVALLEAFRQVYSFLSVTEAGLYYLTAKLAKEAKERGGKVGDERYQQLLVERMEAERSSEFIQKRLYPPVPEGMEWVCFYPMSKKRDSGQNWYVLPIEERSRLMYEHGLSGRRYAGRILQIVTGAMGFDAWEWGVTLFGRDPLDFKRIVSEMRFDEASSKYGEFGEFFVGRRVGLAAWARGIGG